MQSSVIGEAPAITAPVRLEGQSNSEVLFTWMLTNRYLWMLEAPFDKEVERIIDPRAGFHLAYRMGKWRRERNHREHPAVIAPGSEDARRAAFERLDRLIQHHLLDNNVRTTTEGPS